MRLLVDANTCCRLARPDDEQHEATLTAVRRSINTEQQLFTTPQVLREFWVVATRPRELNGIGMTADEAANQFVAFDRLFELLLDPPDLHARWRQLVQKYHVLGKRAHDAALVAAAECHALDGILTLNARDFWRFADSGFRVIDALDPGLDGDPRSSPS